MIELLNTNQESYRLTATTFYGLEDVLTKELLSLGARDIEQHTRAVSFTGDKGFIYKANYCLRTALHVLKPIAQFEAYNEQELYDRASEIEWINIFKVEQRFAISSVLNSETFTHSQFISQKVKDAIVDQFRKHFGKRPSVDLIDPEINFHVHIFKNRCTISMDSSGESLHKRGYRVSVNKAPIKEAMAAGLILLSGWDKKSTFLDPMCGSATFPIEAAMIAANIPPGYFRDSYVFKNWNDFDEELYEKIKASVIEKINDNRPEIIGRELSSNVARKAWQNVKSAKVDDLVKIETADFFQADPPQRKGTLIINPPYGERMDKDETVEFYKKIGDTFKKKYAGFNCWVLTSGMDAMKNIGLRPSRKITTYNGALECKFLKFDMYEGTKKIHKLISKE